MKTYVIIKESSPFADYKAGDMGYIDGYVYTGKQPRAVVIVGKRFVLVPVYALTVIDEADLKYE